MTAPFYWLNPPPLSPYHQEISPKSKTNNMKKKKKLFSCLGTSRYMSIQFQFSNIVEVGDKENLKKKRRNVTGREGKDKEEESIREREVKEEDSMGEKGRDTEK